MATYFNPNLSDSTVQVDPNDTKRITAMRNSGYIMEGENSLTSKPQQQAPQTPQTSPTQNTAINRPVVESALDAERRKYYEGLNRTQPNEAELRQQEMLRMQARIDAINKMYDQELLQARQVGQGRLGEQRAIAAARGIMGSDFGIQEKAQVQDLNLQNENAVNARRNLEVQGVFGEIDANVQKRLEAEQSRADKNSQEYINYLAGLQQDSRQRIVDMAKSGIGLETLSQEEYKKLLDSSGYSTSELDAIFKNANDVARAEAYAKKKANLMEISPGASVYDPSTGTFVTAPAKPADPSKPITERVGNTLLQWNGRGWERVYTDSGAVTNQKIVKIDGVDYIQNQDGTYSKPTVPTVPTQEKIDKANDVIAKIDDLLSDKNLSKAIGPISSNIPQFMRSGARNDVDAKIQSLIAGIAIENLGLLKGPMSDKDIAFIKEASSGLNTNMSEEGFKNRLMEIKNKFEEIKNKAATSSTVLPTIKSIDDYRKEFPQATDAELQQLIQEELGKTKPGSVGESALAGVRGQRIGALSARYESSGDPGAIGYDNTGGLSYGTYQLAHNNAQRFVEQSPYREMFSGVQFNSPQWQKRWKEVAAADPEGFKNAQHDYIVATHFTPQAQKLAQAGINLDQYSPALRDVVFSTAVQHGANTDVIAKAFQRLGKNANEADLIREIYKERWSGGKRFAQSTPDVQRGVYNRFFGSNGEMNQALAMLQSYQTMA